MIINDDDVSKFQAYIIYGKNINEILKRIINYLNGCSNIISDSKLKNYFDIVCTNSSPQYVEFSDIKMLNDIILRSELGKGLVLKAESPRNDVYAIAFIPINQRNKDVASK
ncbi:hypothetical protein QPL79_03290 [Ignisphaera sp. 4213-co]|uniref:Uncharacterized protein n=1 Tax=Ignisphaera cupida TaxID=3050454 RepID=A0ABD4Z500_9CREN|nr:hypothetical protein [Ignisphaera sp. 4213-co]MDK6028386.1 hypothetical protein [Ignisphaera sp. 4213-co]